MQPQVVAKESLFIRGITGHGAETGKLWEEFQRRFALSPFATADADYYEVRFFKGEQPLPGGEDVHVGALTKTELPAGEFTTLQTPAGEYALWPVLVAKGYDSENTAMAKWQADNALRFGQRQWAENDFVVERYGEEFKGGTAPDSVVELWLPVYRYCQSGMMPMLADEDFGTNADGSKNLDYCRYCYQKGAFLDNMTMAEMIEFCIPHVSNGDPYASPEAARKAMSESFPKLKRWAK